MKSFKLVKSDFEFRNDDVSFEFNEYIDYVFISNSKMFFVFKNGFASKNPKNHIIDYYVCRGWKKSNIIFLNQ